MENFEMYINPTEKTISAIQFDNITILDERKIKKKRNT